MAQLQTIRSGIFGAIATALVALGLLMFIVDPTEIASAFQNMSSKYDVGEIAGKNIPYTDFKEDVDRLTSINEMLGGRSLNAEQQAQTRDAVWQDLIYKHLFVKNANKAGIYVGEDELVDLTSGNNLSPLIAQNPAFADESGAYSKDQFVKFIQNVDGDPNLRNYWNYLQSSVVNQAYFEKYASLFTTGAYTNPIELRREIADNNNTTDVDFVMIPVGYGVDSTIVVSDKEITDYYNAHKKNFKQQASRDIEYVVYEVTPSAKDIEAQNAEFVTLYDEFSTADNVRSFLQRNSDRQWSDSWYKGGDLRTVNQDIDTFVAENNSGVSPIYKSGETFYAARIMETANVPDSVYVRHIMLQGADARHLADSLLGVLGKGNFSTLAALYSQDQGNAADGEQGNLGWMTQNAMIPGFESVLTAPVGKPYIVNTVYGTHIVEVTKTTKPVAKKKVAVFEKATLPSKETYAEIYNKANILAVRTAGKYANYKAACDSTGIYSRSMTINEGTDTYGSIGHAKEVTRWAFDNKPGKASGIITVDNNYFFVVAVKDAHKEGYAKVSEVAENIRTQLYREKYSEKHCKDVADKIAGLTSLDAIADKLGSTVSNLSDVSFSTNSAPTTEPAFIGAVAAAKEGVITGPVAGIMGTYVFQVNGRETGAFYTEDDAKAAQARMDSYHAQMLLPLMMDKTVDDNRARFY